jgi:hypothetical protein
VWLALHQICGEVGEAVKLPLSVASLDGEILALTPTKLAERLPEYGSLPLGFSRRRARPEYREPGDLNWRRRGGGERH